MKKYFLHDGINQDGPFDLEELKQKKITSETQIWFEGRSSWTSANNIEELKSIFYLTPPPFEPVLATKDENVIIGKKPRSKFLRYSLALIFFLVIGAGAILIANKNFKGYDDFTNNATQTYAERVMTIQEIEQAQPTNFLSVDARYNKNFWGTKIKIYGMIINKATVASYKDPVIKITYLSKTKTELGSKELTLYETLLPTSTKNFELKVDNYKDVNTINVEITNAIPN
jgi:GYF domain 2